MEDKKEGQKAGPYGPAVVGSEIRYFSATALSTGDPTQDGGCARRYWFKYIAKKKEPQTKAQNKGHEELHKPIEQYYTHGIKNFPRFVLAGVHFLPAPSDKILSEVEVKDLGLTLAGIPVVGKIDLLNGSDKWIDPEGNHKDIGVFEVNDWKSTGNLQWAKSGPDLLNTVQMPLYGAAVRRLDPTKPGVRLSHTYFSTKAVGSKKVSIYADFKDIELRKKRIEGVAKNLIDVAKEIDSNKVEANTRACNAYGGCPHREYCSAGNRAGIERLFGTDMATLLKPKTTVEPNVLDKLKALKDQEQKQKEALALRKAFETIETDPRGMPQLCGEAAKAFATYKNSTLEGDGYCGSGELAEITIGTVADVLQLAQELSDTPSEPVGDVAVDIGLVPDNVPEPTLVQTDNTVVAPLTVPESAMVSEVPVPKKRGRKPKTDAQAEAVIPVQVQEMKDETVTTNTPFAFFIDCVPLKPVQSLDPYIDDLCRVLCNRFECADIRVAPKDGPLAFGGWRGVVRAYVLEKPPEPGSYTLFTGMREIAAEVADGLRELSSRNGYTFIKGVR